MAHVIFSVGRNEALVHRIGVDVDGGVRPLADKLSKGPVGLAERELKQDAKFAEAVETIVGNCGESAFNVLFHSNRPQSKDAILKLSRKSKDRQLYRIEAVANPENRRWSVAPQNDDRVPDTKEFAKIISRLERARGSIERSQMLLEMHGHSALSKTAVAGIAATVRQFEPQLRQHVRLVSQLGTKDGEGHNRRLETEPGRKLQLAKIPQQLKAALALIAKNVRDLPTSSYDFRPTRAELTAAKREVARIRRARRGILLALGKGGTKPSRR